jgi:autotransporter-associated beta strand protein
LLSYGTADETFVLDQTVPSASLRSDSAIRSSPMNELAPLAVDSTYTASSGNWSTSANWSNGVPSTAGDIARRDAGAGTATVTVDVSETVGTLTLGGSGSGNWTITPTSLLTFSNGGSGTTISNTSTSTGGALVVGSGAAGIRLADSLTISNTSASTNVSGAIQIGSVIAGTGDVTFYNAYNGSTLLTVTGSIRLTNTNTFTGSVLVQKGNVIFQSSRPFGAPTNVVTLGQAGQGSVAALSLSNSVIENPFIIASGTGGTVTLGCFGNGSPLYTGTLTLNGSVSLHSAGDMTFSNTISGAGGVTKTGPAILALDGSNTFTGDTNLSAGNGSLLLHNANALQNSTLNYTGGAVVFGPVTSRAFTFGGLTGSAGITLRDQSSNAVALTVGNNNQTTTYSGTLAGAGSLVKVGIGVLTLSGASNYTGATTINRGTLEVANNGTTVGRLSGTTAITVNGGGTLLLSGAGSADRLKDAAPITLGGGTIAKGADVSEGSTSAAGLGALSLTANSALDFTGSAGVLAFASFNAGTGNAPSAGYTLSILNYTLTGVPSGSQQLIFGGDQSSNLSYFDFGSGYAAQQFALGNGFYEIYATPVPEPGTYAAGILAAVALGWTQRKRFARKSAAAA